MHTQTIDHSTFLHLVGANAIQATQVVGQVGGWSIIVKYGATERLLAASRSRRVRLFKKLGTVAAYLKDVGISQFDVDFGNYDPTQLKTYSRPDRAEAMRQAHEAVAHDKWFREQVKQGLDDLRPTVPHTDVMADLRTTIERVSTGLGTNRAG